MLDVIIQKYAAGFYRKPIEVIPITVIETFINRIFRYRNNRRSFAIERLRFVKKQEKWTVLKLWHGLPLWERQS